MNVHELISHDYNTNGIYRAKLIQDDSNVRVYIPGLHSVNPFNDNDELKSDINKEMFPIAQWCAYNIESTDISNQVGPAFVMFENGNSRKPVILSYTVIGGEGSGAGADSYPSNTSTTGTNLNFDGTWISGFAATTYGQGDDNGVCGWNGLRYHTISGCHVAIPRGFHKPSNTNAYGGAFSQGYGTILEVKNPVNGKTCIAIAADTGDFGINGTYKTVNVNGKDYYRALDLPPNTQKALDMHGSGMIEFRKVGYMDSWDGSQIVASQISNYPANTTNKQRDLLTKALTYKGETKEDAKSGHCEMWVEALYASFLHRGRTYQDSANVAGTNYGLYSISGFPDYQKTSKLPKCTIDQIPLGACVYMLYSSSSGDLGHVGVYKGNGEIIGNHSWPGDSVPATRSLTEYKNAGYKGFCWGWDGNDDLTK